MARTWCEDANARSDNRGAALEDFGMTKAFSLLMIIAMVVQIVRPLGLPGLRKRADAWKLALAALATIMVVAMTKGE